MPAADMHIDHALAELEALVASLEPRSVPSRSELSPALKATIQRLRDRAERRANDLQCLTSALATILDEWELKHRDGSEVDTYALAGELAEEALGTLSSKEAA